MKQTSRILVPYAADTAGVCSALFELGGMTVVHDASGCNSTYATFDEPRWYDRESMTYISALTEMDAVMGDDEKLVGDVTDAAEKLHPKFIALCGSPVPLMVGTDLPAIAREIQRRTGIPTWGLKTSGMRSYLPGAAQAMDAVVRTFCREDAAPSEDLSVNVLGATPLDFGINGSVESIAAWLRREGFRQVCCLGMNSTLDEIAQAGTARVNLVVSSCGLTAARTLKERFGTPYVAGVPYGSAYPEILARELRDAAESGKDKLACAARRSTGRLAIVGEIVTAGSLARAFEAEYGLSARVLCPLEAEDDLLAEGDERMPDEDDAVRLFTRMEGIAADPLYHAVCPAHVPFYPLPHAAFSGRCYLKSMRNLIDRKLESGEKLL